MAAKLAGEIADSFSSLQGIAGVDVTLTRQDRAVTLIAVPATTEFEVDTGDVIEYAQSRDFTILAADLVLGGFPSLPKRGDTIRETIDGVETVYSVGAPAGSNHFKFEDPFRTVLRIYTMQTGEG